MNNFVGKLSHWTITPLTREIHGREGLILCHAKKLHFIKEKCIKQSRASTLKDCREIGTTCTDIIK